MAKKDDNDVVSNELPKIYRYSRKIDSSGNIFEEDGLIVRGKSLTECKTVFDRLNKEK